MKLKEYIKNLQEFSEINPECLEMEVVYSKDDEGNGFNKVHYEPSKGVYDEEDRDFQDEEIEDSDINSVCIN